MLQEQANGLGVGGVGETSLLLVAQTLRGLRQGVVVGAQRPRRDAVGHAPFEDHRPGDLGHLLEIVCGAVRDASEDDLLCGPAGEGDDHPVDQLLLRVEVAVLFGEIERVAEGVPARDDRDLLKLHRGAHQMGHERMAGFVIREDPALLLRQDLLLLEPGNHALERCVEVSLAEIRVAAAAGEDRGLVADVGELRACEAARLARDLAEIDARGERLAARVHREDRDASLEIGRRNEHLAIEAPRAQQRLVEILDAVRRAHHDDLVCVLESVELDEQLVQRLVLLAVEAVAGALRADGVELVDEHDRRRILARLLEELANAGRAESREHLDEGRGARGVEVRAGLVRDGLREQRLAGARRTVEQQALRHLGAEPLEPLRVAQEVDDLHQLAANLLDPGDVLPGHARLRA